MNTVVNKLLDVDRDARRILDDAQQYYDKTIEDIEIEKKKMIADYEQRERRHLEEVREMEDLAVREHTAKIREQYAGLRETLNRTFEDLHAGWEDELFKKCTGR